MNRNAHAHEPRRSSSPGRGLEGDVDYLLRTVKNLEGRVGRLERLFGKTEKLFDSLKGLNSFPNIGLNNDAYRRPDKPQTVSVGDATAATKTADTVEKPLSQDRKLVADFFESTAKELGKNPAEYKKEIVKDISDWIAKLNTEFAKLWKGPKTGVQFMCEMATTLIEDPNHEVRERDSSQREAASFLMGSLVSYVTECIELIRNLDTTETRTIEQVINFSPGNDNKEAKIVLSNPARDAQILKDALSLLRFVIDNGESTAATPETANDNESNRKKYEALKNYLTQHVGDNNLERYIRSLKGPMLSGKPDDSLLITKRIINQSSPLSQKIKTIWSIIGLNLDKQLNTPEQVSSYSQGLDLLTTIWNDVSNNKGENGKRASIQAS